MADQDPNRPIVTFKSDTPVVGIEFNPRVNERDEYTYQYTWYRADSVKCSVHKSKNSTLQCLDCVDFKLPIENSYHCSEKCYKDAWTYHRRCHREASELNNTFDAKDGIGERSDRMFDENTVIHHEDTSWLEVGSTRAYVPSKDDLGCVLRLSTLVVGTAKEDVKETAPVIEFPPLPQRAMIPAPATNPRSNSAHLRFTVLSYNILADHWAKISDATGKLSDHPKWCLQWEYRRENLLREIINYDADIICLQEVQDDHFKNFLKPKLQQCGYSVVHKFKKSENFDIDGKTTVKDGCAIFFRNTKFENVGEFELEYRNHNKGRSLRWLKDNVAIVIKLETIGIWDASFYVANTHIYSSEEYGDAKLFQVSTLVHELENLSSPVLLCGDLNSCPESAPYYFVVNRRVDNNDPQFPHEHDNILRGLKLNHELPLLSAYAVAPGTHREPFTHFSRGFRETLDYIFFTGDRFWLNGVLEIPDIGREEKKHIPSPLWSSDHVAIMAELELVPPQQPSHTGIIGRVTRLP